MVGAYRVVIQNKKIKFDFEIRRNIIAVTVADDGICRVLVDGL